MSNASACARFLLCHDREAIQLDATDTSGWTALHRAVKYLNNEAVVRMLLEAGADPTIKDPQQRTPTERATACGNHEYVPLLRAAEAEPQRALLLGKARLLSDTAHATRALPAYLSPRLPTIRLRDNHIHNHNHNEEDEESEVLHAVAKHVVEGGLVEAHVKELLAFMTPRWATPVAGEGEVEEEDSDDEDDSDEDDD